MSSGVLRYGPGSSSPGAAGISACGCAAALLLGSPAPVHPTTATVAASASTATVVRACLLAIAGLRLVLR
ncbi:hypothetical protein [Rhodococcus yananensis]|uniref:hypothetical protein n=1 Tax=Rhodococcus yananensis TaxID=2879464 RepID=UPI003EBF2E84